MQVIVGALWWSRVLQVRQQEDSIYARLARFRTDIEIHLVISLHCVNIKLSDDNDALHTHLHISDVGFPIPYPGSRLVDLSFSATLMAVCVCWRVCGIAHLAVLHLLFVWAFTMMRACKSCGFRMCF